MKVLKKLIGNDGSAKYLFRLDDNNSIEALHMNNKGSKLTFNNTICVSSQVGCKLGCIFCATGKQGYTRDLSPDEVLEQVKACNLDCQCAGLAPLEAVVFAGMGEPLFNYENVKSAIHKIHTELGINNFEIATVGVVPRIYKIITDFKGEPINIRLNISLHASTDELRRRIIPFANEYSIDDLLNAAADYSKSFNSRVRLRYMLLNGLNDSMEDANRLCSLLENKSVKLIISNYNENDISGLTASNQSRMEKFHSAVSKKIDCEIFCNFGSDIKGGCGQLVQHIT